MIRDKDKVYGEVNHEDTVLADNILSDNKFVVGTSINKVDTRNLGAKRILHSDQSNKLKATDYNAPNKYIGTDTNSIITLYNRIIIPATVPTGRELVIELKGSENASDVIAQRTISLIAPFFYEVEVIGADGGGGAGILQGSAYGDYGGMYGKNGGVGGYYKGIHLVRDPLNVILQPGNSGEGAKGFIVSGSGKSRKITGTRKGGRGGRSIELFDRIMSFDIDGKFGGDAGIGQNGGADGGSVAKMKWDGVVKAAGGGGGGANGPYGGEGGKIWYDEEYSYDIPKAVVGGAGGAGGGFGKAGEGGSGNGGDLGPDGYGGGAGGDGYSLGLIDEGETAPPAGSSGGGGGGGGGSRLVIGDLEILAGGGGGGAGGSRNYSDINIITEGGENGSNNINTQTNPSKFSGGAGGIGLHEDYQPTGNTAGKNGDPGVIRIWRCIP